MWETATAMTDARTQTAEIQTTILRNSNKITLHYKCGQNAAVLLTMQHKLLAWTHRP